MAPGARAGCCVKCSCGCCGCRVCVCGRFGCQCCHVFVGRCSMCRCGCIVIMVLVRGVCSWISVRLSGGRAHRACLWGHLVVLTAIFHGMVGRAVFSQIATRNSIPFFWVWGDRWWWCLILLGEDANHVSRDCSRFSARLWCMIIITWAIAENWFWLGVAKLGCSYHLVVADLVV